MGTLTKGNTRVNASALEVIMERSGLTARALADACDPPVHRTTVVNILSGRRQPSADVALRLARALKVPLLAILADPEDAP